MYVLWPIAKPPLTPFIGLAFSNDWLFPMKKIIPDFLGDFCLTLPQEDYLPAVDCCTSHDACYSLLSSNGLLSNHSLHSFLVGGVVADVVHRFTSDATQAPWHETIQTDNLWHLCLNFCTHRIRELVEQHHSHTSQWLRKRNLALRT